MTDPHSRPSPAETALAALAPTEDVDDPDDRRPGRRMAVRGSPLRPRLSHSQPHDALEYDDGLPAPRQLPPARSVSMPLRSSLARRRSTELMGSFESLPVTPEAGSAPEFGMSASSSNSASTSAAASPSMSRRSSSSGSSCTAKSVRWASLVMSVATHSAASYDRAPWNKRECDSLAIPLCKGEDDRWLHVDIDPKRQPPPTSPPRVSSPAYDVAHDLSLASLALTSTRSPLYLDDEDEHFALESPSSTEARWSHGMTGFYSGGETDCFGGF